MRGEAALRQQAARHERRADDAEGDQGKEPLHEDRRDDRRQQQQHQRDHPGRPALAVVVAVAVERAVEPGYQLADPDHGMADRADEPVRIAEGQFGDERQQSEGKIHGAS